MGSRAKVRLFISTMMVDRSLRDTWENQDRG